MAREDPRYKSGSDSFKQHRQGMAAVAIRLAGATYTEVAEALGFLTADDARIAVESELANMALEGEGRERLRTLESTRLERLLRSVWQKATTTDAPEHLAAVKVALNIVDRRIRLFGLDAPAEVTIHTPTQHEIDGWVAEMTAMQHRELAVLEASVVEPGEPAALDPA